MRPHQKLNAILTILIPAPIWYYLLYHILISIHASELMMFLFWIYTPVSIIVSFISKCFEK